MPLTLETVSAGGIEYRMDRVDRLVVRRREAGREVGSEIAICPHHAPLLMQVQPCTMRITREGSTVERELQEGVLEVYRDHVTVALT